MQRLLQTFVCLLLLLLATGCLSSSSNSESFGKQEAQTERNCDALEPDNPYSPGSGHYAGYEWAEQNEPSVCGGNSTSFIEGCQVYQQQAAAYEACLNGR